MKINLPQELESEYNEIQNEFSSIHDSWKNCADEIIPEDRAFAARIIQFIVGVIDYVIENYQVIEVNEYQDFLGYYDQEFYYGPQGDDRNYLGFDETFEGEPVTELGWEFRSDGILPKEEFRRIRSKYATVLALISKESSS